MRISVGGEAKEPLADASTFWAAPASGGGVVAPLSRELPADGDETALLLENQRVLREAMRTDSEGLELKEHPDGRRSVFLEGRFLHMSVAFRDEDGSFIKRCYNDYEAALNPRSADARR